MITIKMSGPQGSGKSKLARKIYALAKAMNVQVEVFTTNDQSGRYYEKEEA